MTQIVQERHDRESYIYRFPKIPTRITLDNFGEKLYEFFSDQICHQSITVEDYNSEQEAFDYVDNYLKETFGEYISYKLYLKSKIYKFEHKEMYLYKKEKEQLIFGIYSIIINKEDFQDAYREYVYDKQKKAIQFPQKWVRVTDKKEEIIKAIDKLSFWKRFNKKILAEYLAENI